jgi:hypothetical protein
MSDRRHRSRSKGHGSGQAVKRLNAKFQTSQAKDESASRPLSPPLKDVKIDIGEKQTSEVANISEKEKAQWWGAKGSFVINGLMAVATMILALLAFYQLKTLNTQTRAIIKQEESARETIQLTKDHFQEDQRPYVWLTNNLGKPECENINPDASDCQVLWTWHFTNYGKTPARDVHFNAKINIGSNVLDQPREFAAFQIGAPLPPNKDDFSTAVHPTKISKEAFLNLLNMEKSILIFGRINYADAHGHANADGGQYETRFCYYRLKTGAITYCRDDNYIK